MRLEMTLTPPAKAATSAEPNKRTQQQFEQEWSGLDANCCHTCSAPITAIRYLFPAIFMLFCSCFYRCYWLSDH